MWVFFFFFFFYGGGDVKRNKLWSELALRFFWSHPPCSFLLSGLFLHFKTSHSSSLESIIPLAFYQLNIKIQDLWACAERTDGGWARQTLEKTLGLTFIPRLGWMKYNSFLVFVIKLCREHFSQVACFTPSVSGLRT